MKLFLIFISLVVSSFFMLSLTNKLAAEEVWKIKEFDTFGYASVSGEIQHGDKLAFILLSDDNCETVSSWFTFYTWQDPSDFDQLVDKDIPIMLNGEIKISATVVSVIPFLNGKRVILTLGTFRIKEYIYLLHETYKEYQKYEIEIIDGFNFQASKYFDIAVNNWKLDNLIESISKANEICKEINLEHS